MPKMKTNSGAKKRFKLTGTGKIRKRNLGYWAIIDKTNEKNVKQLLSMK